MPKPLIIANWKMNPDSPGRAALLARKIEEGIAKFRNVEVVIAPPYPFLIPVSRILRRAKLGSQNAFWSDMGPYTGEVSWHQLKHLNVEYVIIGHSERKIYLGETDDMINSKVCSVLKAGMKVVLCIGEIKREGNDVSSPVGAKLKGALKNVKGRLLKNLIVCYEPVWAISTMPGSHADSPENAFKILLYLRRILTELYGRKKAENVPIIYGGSVNALNIRSFLIDGKMEGALVGGASLSPEEFINIVKKSTGVG